MWIRSRIVVGLDSPMKNQIQDIRVRVRHDGRGFASEYVIESVKELRDWFGVLGYGVAVVALYIVSYYVLTAVFGTLRGAFTSGAVTGLASLFALAYTGWIGFISYEEFTERSVSRDISQRPSIATVNDAFGLLQSDDKEARRNAALCLSAVVSTSPKYVVNTTEAPPEEIVEYLLPYVSSDDSEVRESVGNTIAFMARDYPESVQPVLNELLELVKNHTLGGAARGDLALSMGYIALSQDARDSDLQEAALELSADDEMNVRIGACYMLAGISTKETHKRLKELAQNDPETEVREHAKELV